MAKSHVLKDQAGRAAGYLMQADGQIRCRVSLARQAEVVLLYEDGASDVHSVNAGREENLFPDPGKSLDGAYVHAYGELLLHTDERAKLLYLQAEQRRKHQCAPQEPAVQPEWEEKNRQQRATAQHAGVRCLPQEKNVSMPQRRWPPPVCWDAEYVQGEWCALSRSEQNYI